MMLTDIVLIPFLLAINANVSNVSNFDPEYVFEVNKTTVVHREPLQTTQLTSTIICHPTNPTNLRCLLYDMMFVTTLKYEQFKRDVIEEVAREQLKIEQWFEMKFNNYGLESTFVKNDAEKMIESLIKHIVQQFNFNLTSELQSGFTIKEKTPIGFCMTEYNTDVVYLNKSPKEKEDSNFQIKPLSKLTMSEQFTKKKQLHLYIMKNRKHCHYSTKFSDFLNGMEVKKYVHIMEVVDNKLRMFTIMEGQLPFEPRNPSGSPVFTETVLVNLINIRSQKTILYKGNNNWTTHQYYILT